MKVTVKLIGPFIYKAGFSEKVIDLEPGATVSKVILTLNLDSSRPHIVTRNGRAVAPTEQLEDGDRLVIAPIYSGG
ncbi:MAG: MoaD/ThiS family protein [Candidatus Aminicenantes bacterium]|nr:MoaD/ThiS family protein [Candidatus Aminicenantes bacterium]